MREIMAHRRAVQMIVWAVVVAAIVAVAENGKMCLALDMDEAKNTVTNMAEGAKVIAHPRTDNMDIAKNAASDGNKYESDSTSSTKDIYIEAKHRVEEAYDSVAENGFSEEAKAKYEAAKERASDAAGEVGAKMRQ